MPTVARSLPVALLAGTILCAAPSAPAQQYAVPAGEAIVLDGGGTTIGHGDTRMHTAYRSGSVPGQIVPGEIVPGEIVAESFPQVRSTQYPGALPPSHGPSSHGSPGYGPPGYGSPGYGPASHGGEYVFDEPGYAGPVVGESVCGGDCCDAGCCDAGYGGTIYGEGLGGPYGGSYGGLSDHVCGACGTIGCTPETCDPSCEGDLACGGPVVCNKFGRCGKFYNHAHDCDHCGLSAGYGFLFLRPHQGDATAAIRRTPSGTGSNNVREEFEFDLATGSRIFAELIRPDAIGARLTYSGLEARSEAERVVGTTVNGLPGVTSAALPASFFPITNAPSGVLFAGPGDVLQANSEVQFSVFDLDATRRLRAGRWLLNTGGGVRIARLEQDYSAVVAGPGSGFASSEMKFHGAGPTGFAEARRPVGNSGFALLGAARLALLAGENEMLARVAQGGIVTRGRSTRNDFVPVGELQLGGEWSAWVNPSTLFFTQLAYEGQIWGGVGNPGSQNGNVGFTGFNLTLGLEW